MLTNVRGPWVTGLNSCCSGNRIEHLDALPLDSARPSAKTDDSNSLALLDGARINGPTFLELIPLTKADDPGTQHGECRLVRHRGGDVRHTPQAFHFHSLIDK